MSAGESTWRPLRTPGCAIARRERDGDALVRGAGTVARLNASALALWELCDGRTAAEEMAAAVRALFSLDAEQAEVEVSAALSRLQSAGLIT